MLNSVPNVVSYDVLLHELLGRNLQGRAIADVLYFCQLAQQLSINVVCPPASVDAEDHAPTNPELLNFLTPAEVDEESSALSALWPSVVASLLVRLRKDVSSCNQIVLADGGESFKLSLAEYQGSVTRGSMTAFFCFNPPKSADNPPVLTARTADGTSQLRVFLRAYQFADVGDESWYTDWFECDNDRPLHELVAIDINSDDLRVVSEEEIVQRIFELLTSW